MKGMVNGARDGLAQSTRMVLKEQADMAIIDKLLSHLGLTFGHIMAWHEVHGIDSIARRYDHLVAMESNKIKREAVIQGSTALVPFLPSAIRDGPPSDQAQRRRQRKHPSGCAQVGRKAFGLIIDFRKSLHNEQAEGQPYLAGRG